MLQNYFPSLYSPFSWLTLSLLMLFSILMFSALFLESHLIRFSILIASASSSLSVLCSQCQFDFSCCKTIFPLSVLHSHKWSSISCYCSLFLWLALFWLNFICFDSQFWLHQCFLHFLFSVLSIEFVKLSMKHTCLRIAN